MALKGFPLSPLPLFPVPFYTPLNLFHGDKNSMRRWSAGREVQNECNNDLPFSLKSRNYKVAGKDSWPNLAGQTFSSLVLPLWIPPQASCH